MSDCAQTLLLEDELKKIIKGKANQMQIRKQKSTGFIPRGGESCFGNFPEHYTPVMRSASAASVSARRILSRGGTDDWGSTSNSRYLSSPTPSRAGSRSGLARKELVQNSGPPSAGSTAKRKIKGSFFRIHFDRGSMPIHVHHAGVGNRAVWKVDMTTLDYAYYLPIFFDGIREKEDPHRFLAIQGTLDLLEHANPGQVRPVIPLLVPPLKTAFTTRDREVICVALKILQTLVTTTPGASDDLVPYFRQLLPVLNIYYRCNENIGDSMMYGQRKQNNVGDLIAETLMLIEQNASAEANAFINIKYMIPVYESCMVSPSQPDDVNSLAGSIRQPNEHP
jgi:hypothetical protein